MRNTSRKCAGAARPRSSIADFDEVDADHLVREGRGALEQILGRLRVHRERGVADLARPLAGRGEIDDVALEEVVAGGHLRLELARHLRAPP